MTHCVRSKLRLRLDLATQAHPAFMSLVSKLVECTKLSVCTRLTTGCSCQRAFHHTSKCTPQAPAVRRASTLAIVSTVGAAPAGTKACQLGGQGVVVGHVKQGDPVLARRLQQIGQGSVDHSNRSCQTVLTVLKNVSPQPSLLKSQSSFTAAPTCLGAA